MRRLKPGAHIAVIAPASSFDPEKLASGLEILKEAGFRPQPVGELMAPHRYLAASDDHRLEHLTQALTEHKWDAVWAVRGGFGITRILDRLSTTGIGNKPVLGFSDLTPLLEALRSTPAFGIHAPVIHSLAATDEASRSHLFALLAGEARPIDATPWVTGSAAGPVVGGNLSLIAATCGTPHQLDARGAIVVLEEVGEPAYKIDRMLTQCRQAGAFRGAVGFIIGQFDRCTVGRSFTLRDLFEEHLGDLGIPISGEAPIGHGPANRAFIVGCPGVLNADGLSQSLRTMNA